MTEAVKQEHVVRLQFTDVGKLPPPVLQFINVTFGYSPDRILYENVRLPSNSTSHFPSMANAEHLPSNDVDDV